MNTLLTILMLMIIKVASATIMPVQEAPPGPDKPTEVVPREGCVTEESCLERELRSQLMKGGGCRKQLEGGRRPQAHAAAALEEHLAVVHSRHLHADLCASQAGEVQEYLQAIGEIGGRSGGAGG